MVTNRAGKGYFQLWNSELADQNPSSSGAATRQRAEGWTNVTGRWTRKETPARGGKSAAGAGAATVEPPGSDQFRAGENTPRTSPSTNSPWTLSACETCNGAFVSGTIECLQCGAAQFYRHTRVEHEEYVLACDQVTRSNVRPRDEQREEDNMEEVKRFKDEDGRQGGVVQGLRQEVAPRTLSGSGQEAIPPSWRVA